MTAPAEQSLGEILAAFLRAAPSQFDIEDEAQRRAAFELVRKTAPLMGVSEIEAFDALTYVPDNLLPLLQSPQGWSALSAFVASDLGVVAPAFKPTVH